MGPIACTETLVTNYQSTLGNIAEERISHLHYGERPKSRIVVSSPSGSGLPDPEAKEATIP